MATITERAAHAESVLFKRYDELNALWIRAEKEFTAYHIPHTISFEYAHPSSDEDDPIVRCLGLSKRNGAWRICHGEYHYADADREPDWTPITECSAILRVYATKWLPKLREAIVAASERFIPEVERAIERLRKELSVEPVVALEDLLAERAKLNGRHPKE